MNSHQFPRVTFGMIVLNGEPFTRYNLRALYPFAHQIVVVEGACPSATAVATSEGHSRDGTLETLRRFKAEEDPQNKLMIVTAEDEGYPNGFWPEKDAMSQAYARRTTGEYLWQIDVDEFYQRRDMQAVFELLSQEPQITAVSFRMFTFWGRPEYRTDSFYLQTTMRDVHRVFAWKPGFCYSTHRPPTVIDDQGRDLRSINALTAAQLARCGISMYHYELLFPKQVREKCEYYAGAKWTHSLRESNRWAQECYFELGRPFRVHMVYQYPSWLARFHGQHPLQVSAMIDAVQSGVHAGIELRPTADIEALLSRPSYHLSRALLQLCLLAKHALSLSRNNLLHVASRTPIWPLLRRARAMLRRSSSAGQSVSGNYSVISPDHVTASQIDAWKMPSIATAQRHLVNDELIRMYRGDIIPQFRVLADALRATGDENAQIVEVGCASGYYYEAVRHLLGHDILYVGVDYSQALIANARHYYPGVPFEVGDATALPLCDDAAEILVSGGVILHIPDYPKAIAEAARVARKWLVFHRTPIAPGPTQFYTKQAYGVECIEIHFAEAELFDLFRCNGLELVSVIDLPSAMKTYVCRKQDRAESAL